MVHSTAAASSGTSLGEHKPGRIKPGRIKRAALSLQNQNNYICCCLIRPRLYASDVRGEAPGPSRALPGRQRCHRCDPGMAKDYRLEPFERQVELYLLLLIVFCYWSVC